MILQLAESRSAVTQILQFEEKRVKKRMSGAKLLDKITFNKMRSRCDITAETLVSFLCPDVLRSKWHNHH